MALYKLKKEELLIDAPKLISGEDLLRMRKKENLWYQGTLEDDEHDPLWDRWVFDLVRHERELEQMPKQWRRTATRGFFGRLKTEHECKREDMN